MKYRKLGTSGLKISEYSLGSWITFGNQVQLKEAKELMTLAYDQGVNFFDNAEVYAEGQSEIIMGQAFKDLKWTRDSFIVSSKVFWGGDKPTQMGLSRKHIFDACNAALRRLQVEYLDLYFCHRPDPETPLEEIVWAMNDLMRQGKIMYWGTSEWSANDIYAAWNSARKLNLVGPTMEQPEYNLFCKEKVETEFSSLYREIGLGTTIWSPLCSGILTGKYNNGMPNDSRTSLKGYEWIQGRITSEVGQARIAKAILLSNVAKKLNCTLAQMSLAWCLENKNVSTVILGASKISQLQENLKAQEVILSFDAIKEIDQIVKS